MYKHRQIYNSTWNSDQFIEFITQNKSIHFLPLIKLQAPFADSIKCTLQNFANTRQTLNSYHKSFFSLESVKWGNYSVIHMSCTAVN